MTYNSQKLKTSKIAQAWASFINPLRYLTKSGIQQMLDNARHGNDARLQIAFSEMERVMPIYSIVMQRRLSGIQNRKWNVAPIDETPEAQRQADLVKTMFEESDLKNQDGLSEALRHLSLAAFRGRSVVKPFIDKSDESETGLELTFKPLQNWNVLEWNNHLYWCPSEEALFMPALTTELPNGVKELGKHEVAWLKEDRPVDVPGIEIYLRQLVGEETWARAVERYGVAQVVITAPEGTPDTALPAWTERALRIFEGGSGVLPPGAKVDSLTEARGQDPFSKFIEHQTEMIVMLACGSTLGTLPGATGLGSGLAELQDATFQSIVNYDCKRISNAVNDCVVRKCARSLGYDKTLCRFDFVEVDSVTPKEYLEIAKAAKDLGLGIDVEELKALTGLSFIKEGEAKAEDATKPETEGEVWSPGQ